MLKVKMKSDAKTEKRVTFKKKVKVKITVFFFKVSCWLRTFFNNVDFLIYFGKLKAIFSYCTIFV